MPKFCSQLSTAVLILGGTFGCQGSVGAGQSGPNATGSPTDGSTTPSIMAPGSTGIPSTTLPDGTVIPGGPTTGTGAACVMGAPVAPARIWVLTDQEYVNVVRDAFGVTLSGKDAEITTTTSGSGAYTNLSEAFSVSGSAVQGYQRAAVKVSELVHPCGTASEVTDACVEQFVRNGVARAWRRPLNESEVTNLMAVFRNFSPAEGKDGALALVVQAALQTGSFLYRSEIGTNAATATQPVSLTPHELASALGFLFFDSVPDAELWAKANDGTLAQPSVLVAEVDRLLTLPEVRRTLSSLIGYWAGIEQIPIRTKDRLTFPNYTDTLKSSLYSSAKALVEDVAWTGKFGDIFAPKKILANAEMASVYDFIALPAATGFGLVPIDIPAGRPNAGLLTHPGILAATNKRPSRSDPIHRGLYLYKSFVCGGKIPAPPPGVVALAETMTGTERQIAAARAGTPTCAGCHSLFDPLGLPLEEFDPIGRFRSVDVDGSAIDSSSVLKGLGPSLDGPVSGIAELGQRLASSRGTLDCASGTLASYVLGYTSATPSCDVLQARDTFAMSGNFADLFRSLVTAPGFLNRDIELK